jgi:hypothetical protein
MKALVAQVILSEQPLELGAARSLMAPDRQLHQAVAELRVADAGRLEEHGVNAGVAEAGIVLISLTRTVPSPSKKGVAAGED